MIDILKRLFGIRSEDFRKATRNALVQEGRNSYIVGLPNDDFRSEFVDPDMSIDWRNGWRWEMQDHETKTPDCACAGCRRQRIIKRLQNG